MDQIAFIHHADSTKVRIGERQIIERQVPLLDPTEGRVIQVADEDDHGGQNENIENLNEGGGDVVQDNGTDGKSLVALQGVLERSTLAMEVGVMAVTTVTFVTSSVTPTPEREGGGNTDSISGPNLRTQHLSERFVIPLDSSHHSSKMLQMLRAEQVVQIIFADSASPSAAEPNTSGPSNPTGTKHSADTFYVYQDMDSETLR
uniref:Uncharacterized protein n=1 Tax=Tanacetum cinerariifolium TaxID=118510 RepID=A0A6L2MM58_TANCI|nr:hypothetical protein [Tanacetum cinerariifolium]